MLDKYFGFLRVYDEFSVLESLIDHTRIDEEELLMLIKMITFIVDDNTEEIEDYYNKIKTINKESSRIFETISDQIIQANFDHQKQYDLLRIHQRIENISDLILINSKRLIIFKRINSKLPEKLKEEFKKIGPSLLEMHKSYAKALKRYSESKKEVMSHIHTVENQEEQFQEFISDCIELLYKSGNVETLATGTFMVINDILNHLSELSFAIKTSATSVDWLLLNQ